MTRSVFYPRCKAVLTVVFDGKGQPNSRPLTIEPVDVKNASVTRNNYHDADTWQLECDARALPFDPESIASCAVQIYMWDSEGDDSRVWQVPQNVMIRGLADDVSLKAGDQQVLSLSGRDYTGVLDAEWNPKDRVKAGGLLADVVQSIVDEVAPPNTSARFEVVWEATDGDGQPLPQPLCGGSMRSTKKKGLWVKPGKTVWDVVYDLVVAHAFVVYIRDAQIIITNRTQTRASLREAPRIIYGRNLLSLEAQRQLAKERVPRIVIRGWDARVRKRWEVFYPANKREITTAIGLKKNEDLELVAPKGVHDRDTALRYAKMRFNQLARAEATYTFSTRHLTVDAGSREQSLLSLHAGDAVGITFDPFNREHMRTLLVGQRVEHLLAMGYSGAIARFVAENVERIDQFQQPYYCQRSTFTFDSDDGLEIEVEAVNFATENYELAWADAAVLPEDVDAISGAG